MEFWDSRQYNPTCYCGRSFSTEAAHSKHLRHCKKSKKRVSTALAGAKEYWNAEKRRRLDNSAQPSQSLFELDDPIPEQAATTVCETDLGDLTNESLATDSSEYIDKAIAQQHASVLPETTSKSIAERRPMRLNRRLPARFRDELPQSIPSLPLQITTPNDAGFQTPFPSAESHDISPHLSPGSCPTISHRHPVEYNSPCNVFGLFRKYKTVHLPIHDPEENVALMELSDIPSQLTLSTFSQNAFYPYPNSSSFQLHEWFWNGGEQKTQAGFRALLDIIGDPDFRPCDVRNTNWHKIDKILGCVDSEGGDWQFEDAGWLKASVTISVPFHRNTDSPGTRPFTIRDFNYRNLTSVIRENLTDRNLARHFHYEPYELYWQPKPSDNPVRVQGELYTSPAFIEAHQSLQASPGEPSCDLPRVVVALMFCSDATHLTSFGNTKLWPLYLYFGNVSKYRRKKPSSHLCNHVAYFQKLPDSFQDFATTYAGRKGTHDAFVTFCNRELYHAQWKILLDDEFLVAYEHGIVISCRDGVARRFYPRIFTYSADYPEKILLASIRSMGACPCPRCLIPLTRVHNIGMPQDMSQRTSLARHDGISHWIKIHSARRLIYEKNYAVDSCAVERLLKEHSLVPTSNAFSNTLASKGFNLFETLVVDLMHEFELGVWKAIFLHLLRILEAEDPFLLIELDRRAVPTFGRSIRRFSKNVSKLQKFAARDYEDLLQCAIPVFDGLLPEPHNTKILQLLFLAAHWHGLAKLRMHTDSTLDILDSITSLLGKHLREFTNETCSAFNTRELRREADARVRQQVSQKNRGTRTGSSKATNNRVTSSNISGQASNTRREKALNLNTYKVHALGDYSSTIRRYGTTDSYTTESGEREHRSLKARYARTSRKNFVTQVARIERRQARIRRMRDRLHDQGEDNNDNASSPGVHHHISSCQNSFENIGHFLNKYAGDPAIKDFVPKLKEHIYARIKETLQDSALADTQATLLDTDCDGRIVSDYVLFLNDKIYPHCLARFNYTTYDVRRAQGVINVNTSNRNIMVLADKDNGLDPRSPYLYGCVLGIYHVNAIYVGPRLSDYNSRQLKFLWVRWYFNTEPLHEWDTLKLDSVRFTPVNDENAFGFVDPSDVLRSCHIVPAFSSKKVHSDGIGLSRLAKDSDDWRRYYIIRFVDRDMLMRYIYGLGIGHLYSHSHGEVPCTNNARHELIPTEDSEEITREGLGVTSQAFDPEDSDSGNSKGSDPLRDECEDPDDLPNSSDPDSSSDDGESDVLLAIDDASELDD